jgi:Protein of unknown function (DUF1615)
MILKNILAAAFALLFASPSFAADLSLASTARLIRLAEKNVADSQGWAFDLLDVLQAHNLDKGKENICAAIAVIDQESGFVADPQVAGLGQLSEKALREKFGKIPVAGNLALRWLENNPNPQTSFMSRIRLAKTERDLDLAYRALIDHAGDAWGLGTVAQLGLLNQIIEEKNEIDTAGSMQVSVKFALDVAKRRRWLPMMLDDLYAVRDELYTRRGGLYYGVAQLLGFETGYSRKIFRFADYNAGRFASRNAAFQMVTARLAGQKLALDGDLLGYAKGGKAHSAKSSSERAILAAIRQHRLALTDKQVRDDLLQEKDSSFISTQTFLALRNADAKLTGKPPFFAIIPEIDLSSPKIRRVMTTRIFAETVDKRYQSCMIAK